jgi:hypothetical protein
VIDGLVVLAHGIVGREDLPIPRWLFGWAATVVLVASFVALAVLWPTPRLEHARARAVLRVPRILEVACGALGVAFFALVVYAGFAGIQQVELNITPVAVWVLVWVGVPVLSIFLGDVFRAFNPWRAIGRAVGWASARVGGDRASQPLPYPERLGRWPAAVGLFAIAVVELAYADRDDPSTLSVLLLAYAAVQFVGMSLYGVETWTRRGDPLAVYFSLFAALAPLHWHDGRLELRRPLTGITELVALPGTVALVLVSIGSTSFDGFSEGPIWTDVLVEVQDVLTGLGLGPTFALEVGDAIGLALMVGLVALLYRLGVAGMRTVDRSQGTGALEGRFVHSLVPIAFAYLLAHYFSLLVFQGQATAYLASDPLGDGADLFGTASASIDYGVVGANAIWYVQVGALVAGHVAGLVLAHDRALTTFSDARQATRSQYWMLAVMIAFTSLGLWLLSSSNA